jgi:hypothetical protein
LKQTTSGITTITKMPKPKLVELITDIEVLLTQNGFDEFQNAHECAFIDRLLLLKDTIASAFSVDSLLRKSPPPVPALPPPLSPSAGGGAAALATGGDAAPPPSCQFCQLSMSADEAKARVFCDNTYGVKRFGQQPKPFAFAQAIDAFSAVVGAIICSGQGANFANSIADRICFQVWFFSLNSFMN